MEISPALQQAFASIQVPVQKIVDVPPITMDLPPALRPYDTDPQALIPSLEETEGRATISFKAPGSGKTITAAGGRASRAGVSAATIVQGLESLVERGVEIRKYHARIGAVSVALPPEVGPVVATLPFVDWVEPSRPFRGFMSGRTSTAVPVLPSTLAQETPWGVDAIHAPESWERATGDGVKILFIDTGHDQGREDLPSVSTSNCDYGLGDGGCVDNYPPQHGTGVMGVTLARDNSVGVVGVGPGIDAEDVFVWSIYGDSTDFVSQLAEALDSAATWGVLVVNMSFGDSIYRATHAAVTHTAQDSDDMVLVAAAGNHPNRACDSTCYPAGYSDVIGVSGVNDDLSFADPHQSSNVNCVVDSNSGAHVEVSAPFDAKTTRGDFSDSYEFDCGTSIATPHVSGVAALIREQLPSLSSFQVMLRLLSTATDLGDSGWDPEFGYGLVNAQKATGPYVTMSGPDEVPLEDEDCEWSVIAIGGYSTLTYAWYVDEGGGEELAGTSSSLSYTFEGEEEIDASIRVVVSDLHSVEGQDTLEVAVNGQAEACDGGASMAGRGGGR